MVTGGFKKWEQAVDAAASGAVDMVGLARAMALDPQLGKTWLREEGGDPEFLMFESAPPSGITDWFIMRLAALGEDREDRFTLDIPTATQTFAARTQEPASLWRE